MEVILCLDQLGHLKHLALTKMTQRFSPKFLDTKTKVWWLWHLAEHFKIQIVQIVFHFFHVHFECVASPVEHVLLLSSD